MTSIIFDTGPIISLATNNLLWVLESLKKNSNCKYYITHEVKNEAIIKPLNSKKFKFEALMVSKMLQDGIFEIYNDNNMQKDTLDLLDLANNTFMARGNYIQIVHNGEIEVLIAAMRLAADAVMIDERTTRVLIENPLKVKQRLEKKLHTNVKINKDNLIELKKKIGKINVLRSFEIVTVAYEKGLLNEYILNIKNPKKELLESILWAVKLSGCSVSEDEIKNVLKLEKVC